MDSISRRNMLAATAAGGLLSLAGVAAAMATANIAAAPHTNPTAFQKGLMGQQEISICGQKPHLM
jgi:hypothetical protein